jgi:hypothetical protein
VIQPAMILSEPHNARPRATPDAEPRLAARFVTPGSPARGAGINRGRAGPRCAAERWRPPCAACARTPAAVRCRCGAGGPPAPGSRRARPARSTASAAYNRKWAPIRVQEPACRGRCTDAGLTACYAHALHMPLFREQYTISWATCGGGVSGH